MAGADASGGSHDRHDADSYAHEVAAQLRAAGMRVDLDLRNEKINYKVREHSVAHVPLILAVGRRDMENKTVAGAPPRLGEAGGP